MNDAEGITIAEAARRLEVPERTLRHVLKRPEYAAQTRQETRQTKTGTRQSTLLPAALLGDLAQHFAKWENTAQPGEANSAQTPQEAADTADATRQEHGGASLVAYEMVLRERDSRIEDLQARVARLESDLDHAQSQERRLMDALAREQALRALPPFVPPPAVVETPSQEPSKDSVENTASEHGNTAQGQEQQQSGPKKWWQLWKRT